MSGGERQTLALASGLLPRPKVMLVDELSLVLAPSVVEKLLGMLPRLAEQEGTAFIVVEQQPDIVLELADALVILVRGGVAYTGSPGRFRASPDQLAAFYLGTAPNSES